MEMISEEERGAEEAGGEEGPEPRPPPILVPVPPFPMPANNVPPLSTPVMPRTEPCASVPIEEDDSFCPGCIPCPPAINPVSRGRPMYGVGLSGMAVGGIIG